MRVSLFFAALALFACQADRPELADTESSATVGAVFATDSDAYARALTPRAFSFPDDYGPHPEFAIEWWYYTGNLATTDGRRFGFQLTFFRNALAAEVPERRSRWASRDLYFAHFAVTDVADRRFFAFSRSARGAAGLAGAEASPHRVWVGPWRVTSAEGTSLYPLRLEAEATTDDDTRVVLDLVLERAKPEVLQGDDGLSQKGPEPGNASYYYSATRLPSTGTIRIGEESFTLRGDCWLDREWSTSLLGETHEGWDWFSLQLDDGREVMLFHLRRLGGEVEPTSHGSLVEADGTKRHLRLDDFTLEVTDTWQSPRGGTYPAGWRLRVADLDLTITPLVADQELDVAPRYWEGAVEVTSTGANRRGVGYVELVGYAD